MTWKTQPLFPHPLSKSKVNEDVCEILVEMLPDYEFGEDEGGLSAVTINKHVCLLYTSPSPRDRTRSRMPSSA